MSVDSRQWVGRIESTYLVKMEAFIFNTTIIPWSLCGGKKEISASK